MARVRRNSRSQKAGSYASRAARIYADAFGWADALAIESSISVASSYSAQLAALGRLCDALGVSRTLGRHAVLRLLYFAPDRRLTQVEVAREMQVTSANITFLVDGLEKDGLVQRVPSLTDRRTVYVEITDTGVLFAERLLPSVARFMALMLDGFSDEEKREFTRMLERLRQNAEAFEAHALD